MPHKYKKSVFPKLIFVNTHFKSTQTNREEHGHSKTRTVLTVCKYAFSSLISA